MKTLVIKIFLLALPLFVVIYLLEIFDNHLPVPDSSIARVAVAPAVGAVDYLFVGPSYCYNGIHPDVMDSANKTFFILGVATAGPYFYEILLDDYLKFCKQKPRSICISISIATCSDIFDNWSAYPIHRYLHDPVTNESVFFKYTSFKDYILLLRKSVKKTCTLLTADTKTLDRYLKTNEQEVVRNKGFVESDEVVNDSLISASEQKYKKFRTAVFNEKKASYFIKLMKKYQDQNIDLVIFEIPTFQLSKTVTPEYLRSYEVFKSKIRGNGFKFVEDKSNINEYYYFSSWDHMNSNGARRFTKYLVGHLGSNKR